MYDWACLSNSAEVGTLLFRYGTLHNLSKKSCLCLCSRNFNFPDIWYDKDLYEEQFFHAKSIIFPMSIFLYFLFSWFDTDRYEERFVPAKTSIISKSTVKNSKSLFEPIEEKGPKPEPKPRTLKSVEEIRKNIVTMRLSTWPNRPESGESNPAKDPDYQKVVVKTQRQLSEPEVVDIEPDSSPNTRPKRNPSVAKWKTMDLAKSNCLILEIYWR